MVGDHAVVDFPRPVRILGGDVRAGLDQAAHQVGVVVVVLALQQGTDPLKPHAGVDRLHLQGDQPPVGELFVLHEDVVPDLDEPVAVFLGAARGAAPDMIAVVVEDFRAGTAGAGGTHAPEVVIGGDADDPVFRQARDLLPDRRSLIVGVIDGDEKLVLGQTEVLGQKLPCEGDGLVLEVVAEAEIPQHFEEGMVPRGVADIVEVIVLAARTHAFLRRRRALVIPRLDTGEEVLELHHARVGEHQRRVVPRHEGRAIDDPVVVAAEEVEIG